MFLFKKSYWFLLTFVILGFLIIVSCGGSGVVEEPADETISVEEVAVEEDLAAEEAVADEEEGSIEVSDVTIPESGFPIAHDYGNGGEPEICDPLNPELYDVSDQVQEVESTIRDGEIALEATLTNSKGQSHTIIVEGDTAPIYVETHRFCIEWVIAEPLSGIDAASVDPSAIFYSSTFPDSSPEEIRLSRDEYIAEMEAAGEFPTVGGFLEWLGLDPSVARSEAIKLSEEEIEKYRTEGLLTDSEANQLSSALETQFDTLLMEEDFTFIDEELLEPDGDFDNDLTNHPESIVVEMARADSSQQDIENITNFFVVAPAHDFVAESGHLSSQGTEYEKAFLLAKPDLFLIHSVVGYRTSHWYNWKSQTYVDASLYMYQGKAGPYIYRWDGFSQYLTGTSKTAVGWSNWVSASSSTNKWYILRVYGWQSSNSYYLAGSWRGESFSD